MSATKLEQVKAEQSGATEIYLEESKKHYYGSILRSMNEASLQSPDEFWAEWANKLNWFKKWEKILEWNPPFAKWFVGGLINASYNALDVHLKDATRNKAAIIWRAESGEERTLTYFDLWREVNRFANVLRNLGVKKGDRVTLYLPMVPELPIAMLATARIGATHSVVFSGFSADSLATRINDSESQVLVTADGAWRRGKIVQLKQIADEAIAKTPSIKSVIVLKRTGAEIEIKADRDIWWHDAVKTAATECPPEPVESNHPLFLLYTSGTTGSPKGVVHSTGGYLVWLYATMKWVFDIRPEDVYWCTADIGWVTGHSYIVYAPLLHGASIVMDEGALDYPAQDRWWEIIERYGVTVLYTAPTAIRMHMKFGESFAKKHNLSSLRLLGTVGEPINPEAWRWYFKNIGNERCPIVDTWWQTETGGILISPAPGIELIPLKPGSATLPLPGVHTEVVNDQGRPAKTFEKGYLAILGPWPGMLTGLYNDPKRYEQVYWSRYRPNESLKFRYTPPGIYYPGDYAMKDDEGYLWLLGRADDVIKTAGHRIGTTELESSLVGYSAVAEAAVTSKPDEIKGEAIIAFVTLKQGREPTEELRKEILKWVAKSLGPIAVPSELYFVSKLPKTRSGKIMRRLLKGVVGGATLGDMTTLEDEASIQEAKQAMEILHRAMRAPGSE